MWKPDMPGLNHYTLTLAVMILMREILIATTTGGTGNCAKQEFPNQWPFYRATLLF